MTVTSVGENIWVFEQRTLTGSESFFFQYALTAALTVPNLYFQVSYLLLRRFTQKFVQERSPRVQKVHFRLTCVAQKLRCLNCLFSVS